MTPNPPATIHKCVKAVASLDSRSYCYPLSTYAEVQLAFQPDVTCTFACPLVPDQNENKGRCRTGGKSHIPIIRLGNYWEPADPHWCPNEWRRSLPACHWREGNDYGNRRCGEGQF